MRHDVVERRAGLLGILIALVISVGGLVEIVPLYFSSEITSPAPGVRPYTALQLEGRDVYIREGCYNCHSQMVRPLRAETERYGHYSLAGESVYDHPFQFGSKRTGPDGWLANRTVDADLTPRKLRLMRRLGVPYTDRDILEARAAVEGKSDMDALIAYLQGLGLASKGWH